MHANTDAAGQHSQIPTGPQEIRPGCWMVGKRNPESLLQCNTYVRTFDDDGSPVHVCIDPGSQLDFPDIKDNITQLIGGLSGLHSFSLNHQDPDVVGNSPYLLAANPDVTVMVTEEAWRLVQHSLERDVRLQTHLGGAAPRIEFATPTGAPFSVAGHENRWKPLPTPFCHFRGAMAFYDLEIRTLFSGDLFGGLNQMGRVHMIAEERDWAGIAQFHQIYMPAREALRYAVRQIQALDPPVQVIAPQHGYIITGSLVPLFLDRMHELLVGLDLLATELDGTYLDGYREVMTRVLARAAETMGRKEVLSRLAAQGNDGLEQFIRVRGEDLHLDREGYAALTIIVSRLIAGAPTQFANTLRETVLSACAAGDLPVPPVGVGLEEGGVTGILMPKPKRTAKWVVKAGNKRVRKGRAT